MHLSLILLATGLLLLGYALDGIVKTILCICSAVVATVSLVLAIKNKLKNKRQ